MVIWLGHGGREAVYPLLHRLLAAEYGIAPPPPMARTGEGKPYFPHLPHLYFNVSHSGGLLLCSAGEGPLGVDVECVRPRRAGLARRVLSPEEHRWYEARGEQWADFYTLWTLKESRVKCEGCGLRRPARSIAVPLLEPGNAAVLEGYTFRAYAGNGWRAAACCRGGDIPEILFFS